VNASQNSTNGLLGHRWGRVLVLGLLYMVQGLPFGFQVGALPVFLYDQGVDIQSIGYATALALPWALKIVWAPVVERFGGQSGHRRRWILPLQAGMVVAFLVASQLSLPDMLPQLMGLLLLLNFMTATQDIAVDGLAVDLLPPEDLGVGNAAQVVGFKVGMTIAGGVLVWLTGRIDWSGAFVCMAVLVAIVALVLAMVSEPAGDHGADPGPTESVLRILQSLWDAVRVPGTTLMLAVIATYKMGESIIDVMFKPFLMEHGILASQLGLWMGTWGMGASILGSVAGGMLAMRFRLLPLLLFAGSVRLVPELGQLGLAMGLIEVGPSSVIAITLAEHFAGGILTTVMFASMMGWVDRRIGATHFTLLASVEVWGKSVSAFVSGLIAEYLGYSGAFAIGITVGVVFLVLVTRLPGSMEPSRQQR